MSRCLNGQMRLAKRLLLAGASLCIGFQAGSIQAQELEYTAAVQKRLFQDTHVFTFWVGHVPDEDFTLNYPLALAYTYHFGDHLAWEGVRASYFISKPRQLQMQLVEDYGIAPSDFDYPLYAVMSSVVLKPGYGKDSLFNRWVLNHETHVSLGGGLTSFLKEYNYGPNTEELAWTARVAAARKYYLNRRVALQLELEESWSFKQSGVSSNMAINIGLSYQFSRRAELAETDPDLKLLYQYLEPNHD